MPDRPRGTVTFLFTDIEGSTRLWERDAEIMARALSRHNEILDRAIAEHGGVHFKTIGDAFQAAFPDPGAGVAAAVAAQRAMSAEPWPETGPIRVRMALHLGVAAPDESGDYLAPCLNRLARMLSTGFGGQVLLSQAVEHLVGGDLPAGVTLRALGRHRLRDLLEPEQITQLVIGELPNSFPPLKSLEGFATNLPVLPSALIGRERELKELSGLLVGQHRLLTLIGPGGVGKTHLALQAAADNLEQFGDGVWLVPLGELSDPSLLLLRIAASLGVREGGGLEIREALFSYLGSRDTLLVLDNFEQLLGAAADVAELLARCPNVRMLVTSRQRLSIGGERLVFVDPLAPPDGRHSGRGNRDNPAVQLFVERAAAVNPHFQPDDEAIDVVANICAHLDGLPLAIELAAARMSHYGPRELLHQLNNRFQLLTGGRREALSHQQTLSETIGWSYDRLTPDQQRLFRTLSVFAGGWRQTAVPAVAGSAADQQSNIPAIAELAEASLVRRLLVDGDESRWTMLESIREFGRERLDMAGEGSAVRERHAAWCLSFATTAISKLGGQDQTDRFDQLEQEHPNMRASLRWSGDSARIDLQLSLATTLAPFWQVRGYLSEGRRWLEEALERAAPGDTRRLSGMVDAGILAQAQGDNDVAAKWFEQALVLARAMHDRGREAALLNNLGIVSLWRGSIEEAERLFDEALTIAETTRDSRRRADALGNLGAVAHYRGDISSALGRYIECVTVWRELQDAHGTADMLLNIVQLLAPAGEHRERARVAGQEALEIYRELRDPQGEALALSSLGLLGMIEGNLERAEEHHAASLSLFRDIEDAAGEARALGSLGFVALDRGDFARAAGQLADALRLATELDEQDANAYWLEGFAALWLAKEEYRMSARLYGAVEALRERIGIPRPPELETRFARNMAILRDGLGAEFELEYSAGRALSLHQATSEALGRGSPVGDAGSRASPLDALDEILGIGSTRDQ